MVTENQQILELELQIKSLRGDVLREAAEAVKSIRAEWVSASASQPLDKKLSGMSDAGRLIEAKIRKMIEDIDND